MSTLLSKSTRTDELLSGSDTGTSLVGARHVNSHFHSCGINLPIVDGQGQVGPGASKSRYLGDKVLGPARFHWMIETGVKVCSGE